MKRPGAGPFALFAASVLLLVVPAGIPTFWDKHEGRFLDAARGILEDAEREFGYVRIALEHELPASLSAQA